MVMNLSFVFSAESDERSTRDQLLATRNDMRMHIMSALSTGGGTSRLTFGTPIQNLPDPSHSPIHLPLPSTRSRGIVIHTEVEEVLSQL
jgi:hypothetical protein